jgi:hypothetical protein
LALANCSSPSTGRSTLFSLIVRISDQIEQQGISIQINLISRRRNNIRNFTGRINTSELHETRVLLDSCTNEFGRLGFSSGLGNDCFLFLRGSNNNVLGAFGILLSCEEQEGSKW